ncbi:type VI secretion system tube protein Hcp [Cohnella sp. 56]|uniref:type VI secretion system tube protein Hcp n=1 Tax=Cohnella sp. 56 TaxID=3113722 RepID=UPI0030E8790D
MFARLLRLSLAAAIVCGMLLFSPAPPSASAAASDLPPILLTLDGIKGGFDSKDKTIKDAIVVNSFGYGVQAAAPASGAGGSGKPAYDDVTIAKQLDTASLPLLKAFAEGKAIASGYLYFQTRSAGESRTYMVVHLTDIRVTAHNLVSDGDTPGESIGLSAKSVLFKYIPVKPGDNGGTDPDPDASVLTKYRFEPIQAVTAQGNPYIKGFKVTLQATGAQGESLQTQYRINGGAWIDYADPFDIYAADTHTVEYFSTGADGRVEAANVMDFDKGTFTGHGSY